MIDIELLSSSREEEYRQFLRLNPHSLIYATIEFRNFLSAVVSGEPVYLLAIRNGKICGALPYFVYAQPGYGKIINSLPWFGSYGGCTLAFDEDEEARNALLSHYADIVSAPDVLSATLIESPFELPWEDQYLSMLQPDAKDYRLGQITTLPEKDGDIEEILTFVFKKKTRNLVRKALKQGFQLVISDEEWAWQFLHKTHTENLRSIGGIPKPWEHFAAIRQNIPWEWRNIFVALLDGKPVAALLMLYFNQTAEYVTPVIMQEHRSSQPLSFLIWHAMLHATANGFRWWNWGGTWDSQKSLHHFKAGWGAEDYPYSYFISLKPASLVLMKSDLNDLRSAFPYYYLLPFFMVE